jgi:hypothetical protein
MSHTNPYLEKLSNLRHSNAYLEKIAEISPEALEKQALGGLIGAGTRWLGKSLMGLGRGLKGNVTNAVGPVQPLSIAQKVGVRLQRAGRAIRNQTPGAMLGLGIGGTALAGAMMPSGGGGQVSQL